MLMQIHGLLDMCVSKYHFKRGRVVAEACFIRPFDNGCKMGLGCLASLLCCIEGQSIYSCPFPESKQPGSPALPQRTLTKGIFCHKRVERGAKCVWVRGHWTWSVEKLMHVSSWMGLVCKCLFSDTQSHIHHLCVYVLLSCAYMASPDSRGKPTRYYATVLCKTLFCTKSPFHARLFRSLYIKNATGWDMACIVTDSLGAFCPWFDSWEPVTVVLWVSCFWFQSYYSVKSHSIYMKSLKVIFCFSLWACLRGEISWTSVLTPDTAETLVNVFPLSKYSHILQGDFKAFVEQQRLRVLKQS